LSLWQELSIFATVTLKEAFNDAVTTEHFSVSDGYDALLAQKGINERGIIGSCLTLEVITGGEADCSLFGCDAVWS
jgi:hypothetical protein